MRQTARTFATRKSSSQVCAELRHIWNDKEAELGKRQEELEPMRKPLHEALPAQKQLAAGGEEDKARLLQDRAGLIAAAGSASAERDQARQAQAQHAAQL